MAAVSHFHPLPSTIPPKEQEILRHLYLTIKSNIYYLHNDLNVHASIQMLSAVTSDKGRPKNCDHVPRIQKQYRPSAVADLKRGGNFKNIPYPYTPLEYFRMVI